ncbi:hypothetical protein AAFC00_006645 [Neodothiora populina]
MRIFWPTDIANTTKSGVIVGWRNSELDVVVVAILFDVEARNVDTALKMGLLYRGSPHPIHQLTDRCGEKSLEVLGALNPRTTPLVFNAASFAAYTTPGNRMPQVYCCEDGKYTLQIITFDRPDPHRMQYLSLSPISLTLGDRSSNSELADEITGEEEAAEKKRKQKLVEKLRLHTVIRQPRTLKEMALPVIINQINCSYEMNQLLQKNVGLVGLRSKRALSVSEKFVESATDLWDYAQFGLRHTFDAYVYPVLAQLLILALVLHRMAGEVLLRILEWRLLPDYAALKDISATAQQVDMRLQQFCYWPIQYITLRKRRTNWGSITNSHPEYIRFYNSLWLVANDIIIGIALGSYIIENSHLVAGQVDNIVSSWFVEGLQRMISWLTDYPAGLKLNTELAHFLGDLFLWVIEYWAGCMQSLRPALPGIIRFIGFSSFAGASMPVSLFSDLTSILTLHIYAFYIASARIYSWQLTIIVSLFHLFRGKKRNILRNRIDSCDYDLDQLLLGTILFTLLAFLLPTVGVFYATFASARMGIIVLKAALDTWLACLNHFPLFALMLRLKDSRRLPGGIQFDLLNCPTTNRPTEQYQPTGRPTAPTSHIKLNSVPLPFSQTFSQYAQLEHRIRKHYLSPRVFFRLFTGRFVPPIHRKSLYSLQYSMLPARRIPVMELWNLLMDRKFAKDKANGAPSTSLPRRGHRQKTRAHWWSQ